MASASTTMTMIMTTTYTSTTAILIPSTCTIFLMKHEASVFYMEKSTSLSTLFVYLFTLVEACRHILHILKFSSNQHLMQFQFEEVFVVATGLIKICYPAHC